MKVRMKTLMAGPDGTRFPDKVYPVSAQEGEDLIAGGYAEEVKAETPKPQAEPRTGIQRRGRTAAKPEGDSEKEPEPVEPPTAET